MSRWAHYITHEIHDMHYALMGVQRRVCRSYFGSHLIPAFRNESENGFVRREFPICSRSPVIPYREFSRNIASERERPRIEFSAPQLARLFSKGHRRGPIHGLLKGGSERHVAARCGRRGQQ